MIAAIAVLVAGSTASPVDPAPLIVAELNRVRGDPAGLVRDLVRLRARYSGRIVHEPGEPADLITQEGVAAVDEAIAFLRHQPPLPPLARDSALALAAGDHVRKQGRTGRRGHAGADGSTPLDRILRRGLRPYAIGETISYGPRTAAAVVRALIVDDGVADRGHRAVIFSPAFGRAGAACGTHRDYRAMCVIDFASVADAPKGARMQR